MSKRDVLNFAGVKIGELEMPNETTEEQWAEKLAVYSCAVPRVIPNVTARQIRQGLIRSGVSLDDIDAALASLPNPYNKLAEAEWQYSNEFYRSNPLVAMVGQMQGWTSDQLDDLWIFAGTL